VYLAESNQPPLGKLEPLAILKTNPDGAGIVQAIGPLKDYAEHIALNGRRPSRPERCGRHLSATCDQISMTAPYLKLQ
jgi:hypothetical protein